MKSISFTEFVQTGLNKPQYDAVTQPSGNILVIAGAGSGKTRVITARIGHLITQLSADPASIVALTFTNKAALEMKERIHGWLPDQRTLPYVGTFHAYCLFLLRSYNYFLPHATFSILDSDDQLALIRSILKKYSLQKQGSPAQFTYQLSHLKNAITLHGKQELLTAPKLLQELYLHYENEKKLSAVFDFDDLLINTLNLLKNNPECKELYQSTLKHILIDEYQDTSSIQHALLKELCFDNNNQCIVTSACVVGDEDQSIYSWRGASIRNMFQYTQDFAPVATIKIEQNYRSAQSILDTANHLIKNNSTRNEKNLWSEKKHSHRVLLGECSSDQQEAHVIVSLLSQYKKKSSLEKCAVLYRTHYQSRIIEEELIRASIPYKIIGGIQFYERKEIKDLLAYLWLIVNPYDRISFSRVINCPPRGIGQKGEEQLLLSWEQFPDYNFKEFLETFLGEKKTIIKTTQSNTRENHLREFLTLFDKLNEQTSAHLALTTILDKTDYIRFIRDSYEEKEAEERIENIREFVQSAAHFEVKYNNEQKDIRSFLYEVALLQEKLQDKEDNDKVQLMTLHAAKGLEFALVIITGLEEGVLPNQRSMEKQSEIEEERRLFYVGITRAEEYLLVLFSKRRQHFGQISAQSASRFIHELPREVIQTASFDQNYSLEINALLEKWLLGINSSSKILGTASRLENKNFSKQQHFHQDDFSFLQEKNSTATSRMWLKNSSVKHPVFGVGKVIASEKGPQNNYLVTVSFKSGTKKILSSFLKKE